MVPKRKWDISKYINVVVSQTSEPQGDDSEDDRRAHSRSYILQVSAMPNGGGEKDAPFSLSPIFAGGEGDDKPTNSIGGI